jgi:hypothetical protein
MEHNVRKNREICSSANSLAGSSILLRMAKKVPESYRAEENEIILLSAKPGECAQGQANDG